MSAGRDWLDDVTIVAPAPRWRDSFLRAVHDPDTGGLPSGFDRSTLPGSFDDMLEAIHRMQDPAHVDPRFVPQTVFWIVRGDDYLGRISLRHNLNDNLRRVGGHIGYDVVSRWRGRGVATKALALCLTEAWEIGLDRVLLTCDDDNVASIRVIEANGGVLEAVRDLSPDGSGDLKRSYWIARPAI